MALQRIRNSRFYRTVSGAIMPFIFAGSIGRAEPIKHIETPTPTPNAGVEIAGQNHVRAFEGETTHSLQEQKIKGKVAGKGEIVGFFENRYAVSKAPEINLAVRNYSAEF